METKIPRGKVIRVPADIKLKKGRQSQYMPHIIADADKIKSVIEDLSKIFRLTGLPFNALEWIAPETFPQYESLTSASNIPELLEGDQEMLQEAFGKAKFIIRLKINSEKFNYYYTDENLPQEFSLLDVIACLGNASRIQERCNHISSSLDFGDSRKPLVFEFNNYSLPIVKISLSDAKYTAKVHDAIYCSARSSHVVAGLNHVLAKLMVAEVNYTEDQVVKLVQPVQNIKNLFVFYEEMPELEEKLYMARMIKSLGVEDGYEYFYLVESDSRLGVVDIMRHQKDIANISQQTSSGWSTCKCNNCPYSPFSENGSDADVLYNNCINFNPGQLSQMKTDLNNLDSKSPDDLGKSISQLLKVEDNPSAMALLNDLLKDEATKKKIIDFCTPQKQVEIQLTISREPTKDFYPASIQINRKELTKGTKSRNKYAPYVLWIMSLYDKYLSEKYRESRGKFSIFQFANEDRSEKHTLRGRAYFNDVLALLFGVLYNIFSFDGFSTSRGKRNEDWRREWLQAICGYLKVTNEANNDRILEVIGQIDIENLSEIGPILYRDFNEFIGSPGQQNSYWSGAFLSLTETLVNDIPLIGQGIMPKCEFNATIKGGNIELLNSLEKAFFELFAYLEGTPSENHSNKIN